MVTMLGGLPIVADDPALRPLLAGLSGAQVHHLDEIASAMLRTLGPVMRVRSRRELERLLPQILPEYNTLKAQMFTAFAADGAPSVSMATVLREAYAGLRKQAGARADLLGPDDLEVLSGVVESAAALMEATLETARQGEAAVLRMQALVLSVGNALTSGEVCISALGLLLMEEGPSSDRKALHILVSAADDYFTEVEDAFLGQSLDDFSDVDTVSYDSLSKALGV